MRECPSCWAQADHGAAECPSCRLIFAKWEARQSKAAAPTAPPAAPAGDSGLAGGLGTLVLLGVAGLAFYSHRTKATEAKVTLSPMGEETLRQALSGNLPAPGPGAAAAQERKADRRAASPATNRQYEDMSAAYMRYRDAVADGDWDAMLAEVGGAKRTELDSALAGAPSEAVQAKLDIDANTPAEERKKRILEFNVRLMPDELTLHGGRVSGDLGFLSGKARMMGGTAVLEVQMVVEGGRWKVVQESLDVPISASPAKTPGGPPTSSQTRQ